MPCTDVATRELDILLICLPDWLALTAAHGCEKPPSDIWHPGHELTFRSQAQMQHSVEHVQQSLYLPDTVDVVAALPQLPPGDARQGLHDVGLGTGVQAWRCEISLRHEYVYAT